MIAGCFTGREEENAWIVMHNKQTNNHNSGLMQKKQIIDMPHQLITHQILTYITFGLSLANQPAKNYVVQLKSLPLFANKLFNSK